MVTLSDGIGNGSFDSTGRSRALFHRYDHKVVDTGAGVILPISFLF